MTDTLRPRSVVSPRAPRHAAATAPNDAQQSGTGLPSSVVTGLVVGISLVALGTATVALVGNSATIRPPVTTTTVVAPR